MTRPSALESWTRFRQARDAALAEPHGWLTLTSFQWLGAEPAPVEHVPGLWSADPEGASVTAGPDDALTELAADRPVDGTLTVALEDEESLMWVAHGGGDGRRIVVELARRAGRYAIRTRDAEAPTLARFTRVPVFDHAPDLVVTARFEPYAEPRTEMIRTAHPEVPGEQVSAGDVVFTLPGSERKHRLRAVQEESGFLAITFHDTTNGMSTAPWRKVSTGRPGEDGTVVIDFNRSVNYPSAFTPFGTCPMPVDGNLIDAPVEAGEQAPAGGEV